MRVLQGPRENHQRPAIDVLFRTAAEWYGPATCAVLLSGTLDDGVAGMAAVHAARGRTIVQDPEEAQFPDMPRHAIEADVVRETLPAVDIANAITRFVQETPAVARADVSKDERELGDPSVFTCPDCGGTLWEYQDRIGYRYRCRTGHAFSERTMLSQQSRSVEYGLWAALRALEERRDLLEKIEQRARDRGDIRTSERMRRLAQDVQRDIELVAATISDVLVRQGNASQTR
jgi:two-component system chemotaxis response regulator CheB